MKLSKPLLLGIVATVGLLWLVTECAFIVYPSQQVLVLEFGEPRRVIQEPGLHWKRPFIETLLVYEKRILALDLPPEEIINTIAIGHDNLFRWPIES